MRRWAHGAFEKLQVWRQTDFTTLVAIDADTLVQKSLDVLFPGTSTSTGLGTFFRAAANPDYCMPLPHVVNKRLYQAPFCTALMVVHPSEAAFGSILSHGLRGGHKNKGWLQAEQGLLGPISASLNYVHVSNCPKGPPRHRALLGD